jgi:hypothetical protein
VKVYSDAGGIHVLADGDGDGNTDIDDIYYGVQSIKINLKGGDDEVFVHGVELDKNLTINTGAGDDLVVFSYEGAYPNDIDGNVSITTGDGDDYVVMAGVEIGGNLTIDTGNGEDYVRIGDYHEYDTLIYGYTGYVDGIVDVSGNTVIKTGNHDDQVVFQNAGGTYAIEFGNLTVDTGAGDDYIGFGRDVDYDLHVHGDARFLLGKGDDRFDVDNDNTDYSYTTFYGKVVINGGAGFDELEDIDEWFNNPGETFAAGIGAVKFIKLEDINED